MGESSLIFHIGADIQDFNKAMAQIERGLKKGLGADAMGLSQGLVAGFAGLGAGLLGVGTASVVMAANMEQSKIAFTTMLGSAQKAETFLQQLSDFAAATPFELPGLIEASKKMLAFGFTSQQVMPLLTAVGDAVAGLGGGAVEIDRVTLALGQMQAKGKVSAQEMNQLAELGIPAWKMLADQLGISIPAAMKKAEKGAISATAAIPALVEGMSKKFGGMMEKQSQSLAGLFSTAKDNIGASMRVLGDTIVTSFDLKKRLAGANQWLTDFAKALKSGGIGEALSKMFPESLRNTVVIVAGAIMGAMVPALISMAAAGAAAIVPLLPFIAAGAALAAVAIVIHKNWDNLGMRFAIIVALIGGAVILFSKVQFALSAWAAITKTLTLLQAAWNLVMNLNPIGLIIIGIAALIAVGVLLYNNWDTVKRMALNAWGSIKATILTGVAAVTEAYGKFVGVFNQAAGDRIKASADAMRQQAAAETQMVDQRNAMVEGSAQAASDAEEQKALKTWKRTTEQNRANDAAGAHEASVWQQSTADAGAATDTKKEYLDAFSEHFSRTQDAMLTEFNRAQDAQTTAFKRGQDDRLKEFEAGQAKELATYEKGVQESVDRVKRSQERELTAYQRGQQDKQATFKQAQDHELEGFKRGQADRVDAFKQAQGGELESFKRGLEDQKGVFQTALDDEKQTFERHQSDLLDAFKQRQADEIQALQGRQEAERRALDAEYGARMDALDAEQKAMDRAAQAQDRAKQAAAAQSKVDTAKKDVGRATALNDPALLAQAQKRLDEAEAAQADLLAKQKQDVRKNEITDKKDALKTEWDLRKQTLKDQQDAETAAAKERQGAALVQYQRELDDEKVAFGRRQEERKIAFGRMQQDQLTAYQAHQDEALKAYQRDRDDEVVAYQLRQEQALKEYQRRQDDELTAFKAQQEENLKRYQRSMDDEVTALKTKQEAAKLHYQRRQEDETTAWNLAQADRATRYKQELDDLKLSFKDKLGEQETFVNDWNRMADKMRSMRPDLPAVPESPSAASSGSAAPSDGGGRQPIMMADGGIATRPVVMGEAGAEVFAPLAELWKQLQAFGATLGTRMAGLMLPAIASISTATPRVTMTTPGGSDAPIILQATVQNILDGEKIGEYVFEKKFGPMRQQKRAFGLG